MELSEYFASKKALVLDDKRVFRNLCVEALVEVGVPKKNIQAEKSYNHALSYIEEHKPEIIITNFEIHDYFGLDMSPLQLEYSDTTLDKIFFMLAEDAKKAAIADAAEEEVDGFLLKPFTAEDMVTYLTKVAKRKIDPPESIECLIKVKQYLKDKNFTQAATLVLASKIIHSEMPLFNYFAGEMYRLQGDLDQALAEYEAGLETMPIHYKCLQGQFKVFKELKSKEKAFSVIETISRYFPLTPLLLREAFVFSILSNSHEKVDHFFDLYLKLPRKSKELKKVVSASLMTAGKILIKDNGKDATVTKALEYFQKGAIISGTRDVYIANVIDYIIDNKLGGKLELFISMLSCEEINQKVIENARFKAMTKLGTAQPVLIEKGRKLVFDGVANEFVYLTIVPLLAGDNNKRLLETVVNKGILKIYIKLQSLSFEKLTVT